MQSNCEILEMYEDVVCDTLVPFYDMGISCGLPTEMGDIPPEMMMVPSLLTMGLDVEFARAKGDSMIGVGIHDGDLLMLERTSHFNNQDIVVARVDGAEMLKSYYMDEYGRHWLVPSNDRYDATLLTEEMDVKFAGRMVWNFRKDVHETTRNIRLSIERALKKMDELMVKKHVLTREEVVKGLLYVGPLVKTGRHWLGPCRILMDCSYIPEGRYDLFCDLVCSVLPDHEHLPQEAELRRMAVGCFSKPFKTWSDEKAPVHGRYYGGYYLAGAAMQKQLPYSSHQLP